MFLVFFFIQFHGNTVVSKNCLEKKKNSFENWQLKILHLQAALYKAVIRHELRKKSGKVGLGIQLFSGVDRSHMKNAATDYPRVMCVQNSRKISATFRCGVTAG